MFTNYYRHADCKVQPGVEWQDTWDCACNDRCPACDAEIEPCKSDEYDPLGSEALKPKKKVTKLLASSGTRTGILEMIEKFFYGSKYKLNEDLSVERVSDGYRPAVRVILKKGRYRLEQEES